jgi:hypothetical protein
MEEELVTPNLRLAPTGWFGISASMNQEPNTALTLEELPELRRKTEAVARFLQQQIATHLETLRPLFAPERILGKYAGGKVDVPGAERAFTELQQSYRPFTRKPYDLPETLDPNWLTLVGSAVELHPWEYVHPVQGKLVTMSSPVRWVVNYRANYALSQVKSVLAGKETVRPEHLRQFVVNALVLQLMLSRIPGLGKLFQDLRYELKTETPPELKGLPVVTITSCLASFRPADDLIQAATAFSGIPAFIELLDLDAVKSPKDTLRENIEELLRG